MTSIFGAYKIVSIEQGPKNANGTTTTPYYYINLTIDQKLPVSSTFYAGVVYGTNFDNVYPLQISGTGTTSNIVTLNQCDYTSTQKINPNSTLQIFGTIPSLSNSSSTVINANINNSQLGCSSTPSDYYDCTLKIPEFTTTTWVLLGIAILFLLIIIGLVILLVLKKK